MYQLGCDETGLFTCIIGDKLAAYSIATNNRHVVANDYSVVIKKCDERYRRLEGDGQLVENILVSLSSKDVVKGLIHIHFVQKIWKKPID
jgi:hypothetical protein